MEVRDVPAPTPDDDDVVISVQATGICGSDLHIFEDAIQIPIRVPVIIGHEFSGLVAEVGSHVESFTVGDRVTAMPSVRICGRCRYCRSGSFNLCVNRESMGYFHDGSFAPRCRLPQRCIWPLPDEVSVRAAALTEPAACAVHAVSERTRVRAGDVAVIVGPGTIGLLCLQVALSEGAIAVVVGTSHDSARCRLAVELGATRVIDDEDENAAAVVREMTGGYGADVVFECSGTSAAAALALNLVRKEGSYTQVGLFSHPIQVDLEQVAVKELTFTGSFGQRVSSWRRALSLMASGHLNTEVLVTHEVALSDWEKGFDLFRRRGGIKILLDVNS
ncbi:MAG: zinc-binding dehydrogenase [Candidatus Latescibacterota bacterium]|nr:zinc-binding dehydrogenase [Candidatus Latescibacterota bacterium]